MFLYLNKKEVTSEFDGEFSIKNSLNGGGAELRITGVSVDVNVHDLIELNSISGNIFTGVVTEVQEGLNSRREEVVITAADDTYKLQWISVNQVFENQTPYGILSEILEGNDYGITVSEQDIPGDQVSRIDLTRTNAKDAVWKLARSGGYFWYMDGSAIKFSSIDNIKTTLEFDFEETGRTIANSSGMSAMARHENLMLLAGNSGSTVSYIFGSFTYVGFTKTLTWGTKKTIDIPAITSTNTIVDIAINESINTAYILSSNGTIYTLSMSSDSSYTAKTLEKPVGTVTPPEQLNVTGISVDDNNMVVSYKGVGSSASSGNWTLQSGNNNPTGSIVIGDVMYITQAGSTTVYAYNKDTGVAISSENKTLRPENSNPSGITVRSLSETLYRIFVTDSTDKKVYGYRYQPGFSWTRVSNNDEIRLVPENNISTVDQSHWGYKGFTDGTYLYIGEAINISYITNGFTAYDKSGNRVSSKDISSSTLDSLEVFGVFGGVGRALRGVAANSSYIWFFYQNDNENFMRVKVRNNDSTLSAVSDQALNFGAGNGQDFYDNEYSTGIQAEYYNGNIYFMLREERGIYRLDVQSNGSIGTTASDFKSYSITGFDLYRREEILGFGFINENLYIVKNANRSGSGYTEIRRLPKTSTDLLDAGTGSAIPVGNDYVNYRSVERALGNLEASTIRNVYSNTENMYGISFSNTKPRTDVVQAFIPFPEAYDGLENVPQSITYSSDSVWIGYANSNKLEGFNYGAILTKEPDKDITLSNLTSPNITGLSILDTVLQVVDSSTDKSYGYSLSDNGSGGYTATHIPAFDFDLDSANNDATMLEYTGTHYLVGQKSSSTGYRYVRPHAASVAFGGIIGEGGGVEITFGNQYQLPSEGAITESTTVAMRDGFVIVGVKALSSGGYTGSVVVGEYTGNGSNRTVRWNDAESRIYNTTVNSFDLTDVVFSVFKSGGNSNGTMYLSEIQKKQYLFNSQPVTSTQEGKIAYPNASPNNGEISAMSLSGSTAIFVNKDPPLNSPRPVYKVGTVSFSGGVASVASITAFDDNLANDVSGIALDEAANKLLTLTIIGHNNYNIISRQTNGLTGSALRLNQARTTVGTISGYEATGIALSGDIFAVCDNTNKKLYFSSIDSNNVKTDAENVVDIPFKGADITDIDMDSRTITLIDEKNRAVLFGEYNYTEKGGKLYVFVDWFLQPQTVPSDLFKVRGIGVDGGNFMYTIYTDTAPGSTPIPKIVAGKYTTPDPVREIDLSTNEYIERDSFNFLTTSDVPYNSVDVVGQGGISTDEVLDEVVFSSTNNRTSFNRQLNAKFRYITRAYINRSGTRAPIQVGLVGLDKNDPSFDILWSYKGRYILNGLRLPQNPLRANDIIEIYGHLDDTVHGYAPNPDPSDFLNYSFYPETLNDVNSDIERRSLAPQEQAEIKVIVGTNPSYAWYNFGSTIYPHSPIRLKSISVPVLNSSPFSFTGTNSSVNFLFFNKVRKFLFSETVEEFSSQTVKTSSQYKVTDGVVGGVTANYGSDTTWKTITFDNDVNLPATGGVLILFVDRQANDSNKDNYKLPFITQSPGSLFSNFRWIAEGIENHDTTLPNELNLTQTQTTFDLSKITSSNYSAIPTVVPLVFGNKEGRSDNDIVYYSSASSLNSDFEAQAYSEVLRKELLNRTYNTASFSINDRTSNYLGMLSRKNTYVYEYPYKVGTRIRVKDKFMIIDNSTFFYKSFLGRVNLSATNKYSLSQEDIALELYDSNRETNSFGGISTN